MFNIAVVIYVVQKEGGEKKKLFQYTP
jgi:hypothetical protein